MTTQIHTFPPGDWMLDGRLDALQMDDTFDTNDLIFDFHAVRLTKAATIEFDGERPYEELIGQLIPARVRFSNVIWIQKSGLFAQLENVPFDHPVRSIRGMLHWTLPQQKPRFMLLHGEEDFSMLMFYADSYAREDRSGVIEPLAESRYWASAPLLEDATVEGNRELYDQYNRQIYGTTCLTITSHISYSGGIKVHYQISRLFNSQACASSTTICIGYGNIIATS
ncbi:MAG: hypothetical protein AAF490_16180 [Chloroflexota bacterium]